LHLDALPGKPKAADLHDALLKHYAKSPQGFVKVLPATDNGARLALVICARCAKAITWDMLRLRASRFISFAACPKRSP